MNIYPFSVPLRSFRTNMLDKICYKENETVQEEITGDVIDLNESF